MKVKRKKREGKFIGFRINDEQVIQLEVCKFLDHRNRTADVFKALLGKQFTKYTHEKRTATIAELTRRGMIHTRVCPNCGESIGFSDCYCKWCGRNVEGVE